MFQGITKGIQKIAGRCFFFFFLMKSFEYYCNIYFLWLALGRSFLVRNCWSTFSNLADEWNWPVSTAPMYLDLLKMPFITFQVFFQVPFWFSWFFSVISNFNLVSNRFTSFITLYRFPLIFPLDYVFFLVLFPLLCMISWHVFFNGIYLIAYNGTDKTSYLYHGHLDSLPSQ